MPLQRSELQRSRVLNSTLVAAWLVGALTLGRLVHEYVPIGVSSKQALQSAAQPKPNPRTAKIVPNGVPAARFFQEEAPAVKALPDNVVPSFAFGALGGALAAAVLAFGVGLGIVPQMQLGAEPAQFNFTQQTVASPIASSSQLLDSAYATMRAGRTVPASQTMQTAACIGSAAVAVRAVTEGAVSELDAKKRAAMAVASTGSLKASDSALHVPRNALKANSIPAARGGFVALKSSSKPAERISSSSLSVSTPRQNAKPEAKPNSSTSEQERLRKYLLGHALTVAAFRRTRD